MMRTLLLCLPALVAFTAHAIGLQHGIFRSQSTQGDTWLGSAPIVKENFLFTVYPDYLDVELNWEFGIGGEEPGAYKNALEIVGNINLESNSTVVGMLVWYKGEILKAKLKTKDFARKQYEEVVDRNSPVPPRPHDPVLLELIGDNNYDISIYPLEWGGTRKVRIRYLVPAVGNSVEYPYAFSDHATVTIKPGTGVASFQVAFQNGVAKKFSSATELNSSDYDLQAYSYGSRNKPVKIIPTLQDSAGGSRIFIGTFSGSHFEGQMAQVLYQVPDKFLPNNLSDSPAAYKLFASLKSISDSCRKGIAIPDSTGFPKEALRIFSKEPLNEKITWSLLKNDTLIKQVEEIPKVFQIEDGLEYARSFGSSPFYPMSPTMPASLGISLGFIDKKYTLVALEEDSLGSLLQSKFVQAGVPTLNAEDLFPDKDENYAVAIDAWLTQRSLNKAWLLQPASGLYLGDVLTGINPLLPSGIHFSIRNGKLLIEFDPLILNQEILISIYDLKGQRLRDWKSRGAATKAFSWSPSESLRAPGSYILRMTVGAKSYSRQFIIR